MIELLPTNDEVQRELFFPADWQDKRAWSNGHIITLALPPGVDPEKPLSALQEYGDCYITRIEEGYKNPRKTNNLKYKKGGLLKYSHCNFNEQEKGLHQLHLKIDTPCVAINTEYYSMIVAMYGIDIELQFGGNGQTAVSVYKDDDLVALIMPIKLEEYPVL